MRTALQASNATRTFMLIASTILAGQSTVYAQQPVGQPSDQGLQIEVKEVARIPDLHARYALVKKIPGADYRPWRTQGEFHHLTIVQDTPKDLGASLIELLAIVTNIGKNEVRVENKSMKLTAAGRSVDPWEYLFAGVYDGYASLAQRVGVSDDPADLKAEKENPKYEASIFNGNCYCPLKAGEKTWLVLIYRVPEKNIYGKLSLGDSAPITVKIL
jgi:hypothetical protein